jgi:hypothetical protein
LGSEFVYTGTHASVDLFRLGRAPGIDISNTFRNERAESLDIRLLGTFVAVPGTKKHFERFAFRAERTRPDRRSQAGYQVRRQIDNEPFCRSHGKLLCAKIYMIVVPKATIGLLKTG